MDTLPQLALRSQTVFGGVYFLFFFISWPVVIGLLKDYHDKDRLTFNCIPKPSEFTRQRCYHFYTSLMSPLLTPLDFAGITYGALWFVWACFILVGAMILRQRERSQQREQREQREPREQREQREKFRDRIEQRFKWTFICHVFSQLAVLGVMMGLFCGYQSLHFPAEYKCSQANTTLTALNKVEVKITCNDLRYEEKTNLNITIISIMASSITLCLLTAIHLAVTWKTFLKRLLGYIFEREDGNLVQMDSVDPEQGRERSTSGNVEASGAGSQSHHNQEDIINSRVNQNVRQVRLSTKVTEIPVQVHAELCLALNVKTTLEYNDFRMLADKVGIKSNGRLYFEQKSQNPTEEILRIWSTKGEATVEKLIEWLKEDGFGRMDVAKILEDWVNGN